MTSRRPHDRTIHDPLSSAAPTNLHLNGEPAYIGLTWVSIPRHRKTPIYAKTPELLSLRFKELDALIKAGKGDKPSVRLIELGSLPEALPGVPLSADLRLAGPEALPAVPKLSIRELLNGRAPINETHPEEPMNNAESKPAESNPAESKSATRPSIDNQPISALSVREMLAAASPSKDPLSGLTKTQRRVALSVASGLTDAESAKSLSMSMRRLSEHKCAALRKLGMGTEVDLARLLIEELEQPEHTRGLKTEIARLNAEVSRLRGITEFDKYDQKHKPTYVLRCLYEGEISLAKACEWLRHYAEGIEDSIIQGVPASGGWDGQSARELAAQVKELESENQRLRSMAGIAKKKPCLKCGGLGRIPLYERHALSYVDCPACTQHQGKEAE